MSEILLPQASSKPTTDVPAVDPTPTDPSKDVPVTTQPVQCGHETVSVKPEMEGVGTPNGPRHAFTLTEAQIAC